MPKAIRVLVVAGDAVARRALEAAHDLEVVPSAASGAAAGALAAEHLPGVVLVDAGPPDEESVHTIGALHRAAPTAKIVFYTASEDERQLFQVIKAGAMGYLLKPTSADELAEAVRAVFGGACLMGPGVAAQIMTEFAAMARRPVDRLPLPRLTDREREILELLVVGETNAAMARRLSCSENTVKNHVRNIVDKLHFACRMQE